jgi:hypothetical protein
MLPTKLTSAARFGSLACVASAPDGACSDAIEVELMKFLPVCDLGRSSRHARPAVRAFLAFCCRNPGFIR